MKATPIFVTFFLIFTVASIAVPIPLFPGNMITALPEMPTFEYITYIQALANGLTYGFITWAVFFLVVRKLESAPSTDTKTLTQ